MTREVYLPTACDKAGIPLFVKNIIALGAHVSDVLPSSRLAFNAYVILRSWMFFATICVAYLVRLKKPRFAFLTFLRRDEDA